MVRLNVVTLPLVSTAARCSVNSFEASRNMFSLYGTQNSFGNRGYSRYLGNRDEFMGTPSMKGVKSNI